MERTGVQKNTKMNISESSVSCEEVEASRSQSQDSVIVKETLVDDVLCDESLKNGMEVKVGPSQNKDESSVKEASIDDLPPEMLTQILKCVDTRSLFNCRLVNCQWSEISSGILTTRSDATITFHFERLQFFQQRANTHKRKTSLNEFLICMKESKNPPFARFALQNKPEVVFFDYTDAFRHEDWKAFLSMVDESKQRIKIKSLELKFLHMYPRFEQLMEHLKNLLLKKIPDLEEFGLEISKNKYGDNRKLKLFPETAENPMAQLVHLKVIRFHPSMIFKLPGVLQDLFGAAVNLKKIYLYESTRTSSTEIYDFLHPLGKFNLLKSFDFQIDNKFLLKVEARPDFTRALFKLQLEELELDTNCGDNSDSNAADVTQSTNFISSLFESSKNSLDQLKMRSSEFLQLRQFPRFPNLTKLKIGETYDPRYLSFPQGVGSRDVFPAVRELDLPQWGWCHNLPPLDSLPIFPRVQKLSVEDVGFTADCVGILVLLCPNLKHLKIHRDLSHFSSPQINFLDVGRQIWTQMEQLESLEIDIGIRSAENNSAALDSCFTGIPLENCQRLYEMMEAKETLEENESQDESPESEIIELMAKREYPSILDMKNLKKLTIHPYWGAFLQKRTNFFTEELTWISEDYAFRFLPHLKPEPEEGD